MDAIMGWILTGGIIVIAGFAIATYVHVNQVKEDADAKRVRVYERLDEVKKNADDKFVDKSICKILHEQMSRDITDIKTDVKMLLRLRQRETETERG